MINYPALFLKGAITPALIIGIIGTVLATVVAGSRGLFAGLAALIVVLLFFIIHLIIAATTRTLDPRLTFAFVALSFLTKLIGMAGFMIALSRTSIDRPWFAGVAFATAAGWLVGEMLAYRRLLHL
ncbi:MAG: hypothetical protein FJW54_02840 [Actinobacteria bacterium]|nr:hypothetical protein [Actinomycetota bacterium]